VLNFKEIKDLIKLMNEHELSEVEVEFGGTKIKLKRGAQGVLMEVPNTRAPASGQAPAPAEAAAPGAQTIKSPMVGTFYTAPAPDAEPYVKVGSKVDVGQVVCIIEAMKLMNEIKSEIKGVISEIHIQSGEPVEFGQVLFSIK